MPYYLTCGSLLWLVLLSFLISVFLSQLFPHHLNILFYASQHLLNKALLIQCSSSCEQVRDCELGDSDLDIAIDASWSDTCHACPLREAIIEKVTKLWTFSVAPFKGDL